MRHYAFKSLSGPSVTSTPTSSTRMNEQASIPIPYPPGPQKQRIKLRNTSYEPETRWFNMLRPNFEFYHPSLTANPQRAKNCGNNYIPIKNPVIDQYCRATNISAASTGLVDTIWRNPRADHGALSRGRQSSICARRLSRDWSGYRRPYNDAERRHACGSPRCRKLG